MARKTKINEAALERALLADPHVVAAVEGIADDAVRDAKRRSPSRRVARTIDRVTVDTDDGPVVVVVAGGRDTNAFFAPLLERGTVSQPPRPYLRPAVEKAVRQAGGRMGHASRAPRGEI
jgi:HK97 gp10 family phage protein